MYRASRSGVKAPLIEFNRTNLWRVPSDEHGVYVFWGGPNKICVYVGKAELMSLQDRLRAHYNGTHNDTLSQWIKSSVLLRFHYEVVDDQSYITRLEKERIWQLSPLANKQLTNPKE